MRGLEKALLVAGLAATAAWADPVTPAWGFIWKHGQSCALDTRVITENLDGYVTATKLNDPDWKKTTWVFLDEGRLIYRFDFQHGGYLDPNNWYILTGKAGNYYLCPRTFYYGPQATRCDLIQYPSASEGMPDE